MIDDYACPLCVAQPSTRKYYENSDFWIADSIKDNVPMVVLKEHRSKVYPQEINEMIRVCKSLFAMDAVEIDYSTEGHFHFYLRPKAEPMPKDIKEEEVDEKEPEEV